MRFFCLNNNQAQFSSNRISSNEQIFLANSQSFFRSSLNIGTKCKKKEVQRKDLLFFFQLNCIFNQIKMIRNVFECISIYATRMGSSCCVTQWRTCTFNSFIMDHCVLKSVFTLHIVCGVKNSMWMDAIWFMNDIYMKNKSPQWQSNSSRSSFES